MSLRIVIFGAGGVGGYFGARLAAAGNNVIFVARGVHLDAIRKHGLRPTQLKATCNESFGGAGTAKGAFDNPSLGQNLELVQFIKCDHLDLIAGHWY